MNYTSPINVITTQTRIAYEEGVIKAVHDVGFLVEKKELEKALKYDRDQYAKGFSDGRESVIDSFLEIIDEISDDQVIIFGCMAYGDGKEELRNRVLALRKDKHNERI